MGHVKDRWYRKDKTPTARHGKGKRWQVWYTVDREERCGGSFTKKSDAERQLLDLESRVLRGQWVDPNDRTGVVEYARRYFATRPHSRSTAKRVEGQIRNHIEGTVLDVPRLAIKPSVAQEWVTDRAKMLAPSTLALLVKLVRGMYAAAVLDNLVSSSPFARVALPRVERSRVVPLTVAEVGALAEAMRPRYRAMVMTQAGLGLRIGELLALRVEDVNFLVRTVRVEHQIDKETRERVPPKTPKSRRTIPLPDMVSVALAEHIRLFPPGEDGLLFHTATGTSYRHEFYTQKIFKKAVRAAGLPEDTVPHSLRHHFASVLLLAGESVIAVAERLGHEDATLVLTTYGHLLPGADDRTRKAIDAAWDPVSDGSDEGATAQGRPR